MQSLPFWLIAGGVLFGQARLPTGNEVEREIVRHRSAIVRGSAKIRVVTIGSSDSDSQRQMIHHWFDGRRIREDRFRTSADGSSQTIRDVYCWHCPQQGYGFHWTTHQPPGGPVAATIDRLDRQGTVLADVKPLDLRIVGLVPSYFSVVHTRTFKDVFTERKKSYTGVTATVMNNEPCLLLTFLDEIGREWKVWCAPEKQYNVVQIKIKEKLEDQGGPRDSGIDEIELRNEIEKIGTQGIWFPKRSILTHYWKGAVQEQETVELMDVTLNDPLPLETFTVSGWDIPDGTPVLSALHPTPLGMATKVEDGEIRTVKVKMRVPGQIVVTERRKPRWAVYGAIGAGVLGVVLAGYYVFRRRSSVV
ncbi:MAG: hypothetical protein N3G20_07650 [Verrucomicrobiae bacterium]|nr:hypothetical protein [Verrucomicrobiae bacterium]